MLEAQMAGPVTGGSFYNCDPTLGTVSKLHNPAQPEECQSAVMEYVREKEVPSSLAARFQVQVKWINLDSILIQWD